MDFGYTENDDITEFEQRALSPAHEKLARVMQASGFAFPRHRRIYSPDDLSPDEQMAEVERAFDVVARLIAEDGAWAEYLEQEVAKYVGD